MANGSAVMMEAVAGNLQAVADVRWEANRSIRGGQRWVLARSGNGNSDRRQGAILKGTCLTTSSCC